MNVSLYYDKDNDDALCIQFFIEDLNDWQSCQLITISPEDWAKMVSFINTELTNEND